MKEMREAGVIAVRLMVFVGTILLFAAIAIATKDLVSGLVLSAISWGLVVLGAYLAHYYKLDISPSDDFEEYVPFFVSGTLPPEKMEWVRRHLEYCPSCQRFADECRELDRDLAELAYYEPST